MGKITKRQQKRIQYFLKEKMDRRKKADMIHNEQIPKYIENQIPLIRRIAPNLDQILIVASFISPPLKIGLIDRFLVLSEIEKLQPLIVFNKTDLLEDKEVAENMLHLYRSIGYQAVATSAKENVGLETVSLFLRKKRTALAGHSGVGKTSLINAIQPDLQLQVNKVSDHTNKGRHTTTRVRLFHLDEDSEVIDLPGLKVIDFVDIHRDEARFYFREFTQIADHCKFRDCLHLSEHSCAVKESIRDGQISQSRYDSYCQLVQSLS